MGITLILVMGMLAFIINVGLFVKAKINLQNAVDAAAFSGAAVQARQLTNIAYVNWEMRNTYKEWMFKYYVLGQLGLVKGNNNLSDANLRSGGNVSFLLTTPSVAGNAGTVESGGVGFDKYNIPTICVHNNSTTDICPLFALPGIPRFDAINIAGISEIHESFVNKLVEEKQDNCTERTQINFLAALSWAYSSGVKSIPGAPLIVTNRAGAWPEALELAMRMRNLEMIVNRPPVSDLNYNGLEALSQQGNDIGLNERPLKAYMSAFRNLGGGKYKDVLEAGGGGADAAVDELPATFKMTELSPQPYRAEPTSVSGFLIPQTFGYPGGFTAYDKHYLDLQALPINFATMFTTFVSGQNDFENIKSDAACRVSKSAIPIPGYLMGFVKNPQVVTYYAVKGDAKFTGLFFPFTGGGRGSFDLTAYAAAKPFGGRVGPKLFGFYDGNKGLVARADDDSKSASYLSGIDVELAANFKPGMPIPPSQTFWANGLTSLVGGVPGVNGQASFAIPNMIYDFRNDNDLQVQKGGSANKIQLVKAVSIPGSSIPENMGLYQPFQMQKLKEALGGDFTGRSMTEDDLLKALVTSRQVTKYDAANYLIPNFNRATNGAPENNVAPTVKALSPISTGGYMYKLFAPLVGTNLLYTTNNQVGNIVYGYMQANEDAIDVYLQALLDVGKTIYDTPTGKGNATNLNAKAAQGIHANAGINTSPIPPLLTSPNPELAAGCNAKDMASKFNHFFRGKATACGVVPLEILMIEYVDKKNQGDGNYYYTASYFNPLPTKDIMTAYFPGARQGTTDDSDANALNPITGQPTTSQNSGPYSTRRNFYSTKFIPLNKLVQTTSSYTNNVLLESDTKSPEDALSLIPLNPLIEDGSISLKNAFYKDF